MARRAFRRIVLCKPLRCLRTANEALARFEHAIFSRHGIDEAIKVLLAIEQWTKFDRTVDEVAVACIDCQ
jgi:hypothetical protein